MESKLKSGVVVKIVGNKTATVMKNWSKKYPKFVSLSVDGTTRPVHISDILEVTEFKNMTNITSKSKASLCSYSK